MTAADIIGLGLVLPGAPSFESFAVAGGRVGPPESPVVNVPKSDFLPSRTKRRMSRLIQMAVTATREARQGLPEPESIPLILGSADGEINTIGRILLDLMGEEGFVSPNMFHNSVHNAAAGYWSILTGYRHPSTTVSAGGFTFEYALLDAMARLQDGERRIQITAGDERIEVPHWADPPHTAFDFCGSLVLSADDGESGDVPRIIDVQFVANPTHCDHLVDQLTHRRPVRVVDVTEPHHRLFPELDHPETTMLCLLRCMADAELTGEILLINRNRHGETFLIRVVK